MNIFVEFFPTETYVVFDPISLTIGAAVLVLGTAALMRRKTTIVPVAFEKELFDGKSDTESDLFATAVSITPTAHTSFVFPPPTIRIAMPTTPKPSENTVNWQQHIEDIRAPINAATQSRGPLNTVWDKKPRTR